MGIKIGKFHGSGHARRFAGDSRVCVRPQRSDLVVQVVDRFCEPPKSVRAVLDLPDGRRDGLAHVDGLERTELVLRVEHRLRDIEQDLLATAWRHPAPGTVVERGARTGHGSFDVRLIRSCHVGQTLTGDRRDALEEVVAS
jgi:hypothetical protein